MHPEFDVEDLINLPNYKIYLKLIIDGKPSRPFSAITKILISILSIIMVIITI